MKIPDPSLPLTYHVLLDEASLFKAKKRTIMLNWIHHHYAEKIILEDIAKAGHLSRSECCRFFKQKSRIHAAFQCIHALVV